MPLKLAVPPLEQAPHIAVETRPKQVQEWLDSVPLANTIEASQLVRDGLAATNRSKIADDQRLRILELYRETIARLLPSIEELYFGTSLPLPERNRHAATLARDMLNELAYGYKIILLSLLNKRISFGSGKQVPIVVERAIAALSQILMVCYKTYAPTPAGVWSELHQLFGYAARENCQDELIEDSEIPSCSINLVYKQALLLALADPYRLMQGEVSKTADYLLRFGNHAQLLPLAQETGASGFFLVRLDSDKPPQAMAQSTTVMDARTDILLNTLGLARLLHHHITSLEAGEPYGKLNLPDKHPKYLDLLRRLFRHWGIAPKRHFSRVQNQSAVEICTGLCATHHFLSGNNVPTSGSDETEETEITLQYSASPIDRTSQQTFRSTRWALVNESAGGLALSKDSGDTVHLRVGEVIGIKPEKAESWTVGTVRWVRSDNPQHMEVGVQMLAPTARPVTIKPTIASSMEAEHAALWLPELPIIKQPATLLVPHGLYQKSREFYLRMEGEVETVRAGKLVEQTVSYDLFQLS
jgi:hypothetical protein